MKKQNEKTKEEHLADLLNYHLFKGNVKESQVKPNHKDKIKKTK